MTVNPVNDPPSFAAQTPERSVAQTAQAGDPVGAPVAATDVDNEPLTLTYSLSEPGASFFEIEAHTGQITVGPGTVLDAANQPTHTVSVTASDGFLSASIEITVTVTEGAAPPIISGGGGGGGGGPTGPTGPTPSDIDFEWNVKRDLEKLDTDHGSPTGAVGRLSGTRGTVWQYTAIDVASAYTWAELHTTPRNPSAKWTAHLARRVAADLAARGWELETVMTDNGSEFRSRQFGETVAELGARQRFIHAGRPQTNGCVERVQGTILEECWKPSFARHLIPKQNGLRRDLVRYLDYYNTDRAHTGRAAGPPRA